jgi:hypothetical protein
VRPAKSKAMPELHLVPNLLEGDPKSVELVIKTGEIVTVDEEDLPRIKLFSWRLEKYKNYRENVFTHLPLDGEFKKISLAKFILNPVGPGRVQRNPQAHPLDFRKANIFVGNASDQKRLAGKPKGDFTSQFKGVHLCSVGWRATIQVAGRSVHIGVFPTEIEAAIAFDQAAIKFFGNKCFLNFG